MNIKRITIPLSEQEYLQLATFAHQGYRRPQDYARMIILESLQQCDTTNTTTNDKSAVNVCETKTGAFA